MAINYKAASSMTLEAAPANYQVSHIYFNEPQNNLPWNELILVKQYGGFAQTYTEGVTPVTARWQAKGIVIVPKTTTTTAVKTISIVATQNGSITIPSTAGAPIKSISYSGGGAITLTGGQSTGPISTFTNSTSTASSYFFAVKSATGGTGTGATFSVEYEGGGAAAIVSLVNPGSGYTAGDTLTISGLPGSNITVTVSTIDGGKVTYTYSVAATGGSGTGAEFYVTRTGTNNKKDAYVTDVSIKNAGTGYKVSDSLSVAASLIGGSTAGASTLTITVASIVDDTVITQEYKNVSSSIQSGAAGTGATFDITRVGTRGAVVPVSSVVVKNGGTGYSTTTVVKVLGTAIGGSSPTNDLWLSVSSVSNTNSPALLSTWNTTTNYAVGTGISTTYPGVTGGTIAKEANAVYDEVPLFSATGNGRGALARVVRNTTGAVTVTSGITIRATGNGYATNDVLYIPQSYIGEQNDVTELLGKTSVYHYLDGANSVDVAPIPGKEVYYSLFAKVTTVTGGVGGYDYIRLGNVSVNSIDDTGLLDFLLSNIPGLYWTQSDLVEDTDLYKFLSLVAFHLEQYKLAADKVFKLTDPYEIDDKLIPYMIKQLGGDPDEFTDLVSARRFIASAVNLYSKKGTTSGISDLVKVYSDATPTISEGVAITGTTARNVNWLPDRSTSSFEQGTGFWAPSSPVTGLDEVGWGDQLRTTSGMQALSGTYSTGPVAPVTGGDVAEATGFAGLASNSTTSTTAYTTWYIGPRSGSLSSTTAAGATVIPMTNPSVGLVGDYIFANNADGNPYFEPGTTITGYGPSSSMYVSSPPIREIPVNTRLYFSRTSTDPIAALSEFVKVDPGTPYRFSAYFTRGTTANAATTAKVGIAWLRSDGSLISSAFASTVVNATGTAWTQLVYGNSTGSVVSPSDAYYASPFVGVQAIATGTSPKMFIDALMLEKSPVSTNPSYVDPGRLSITASSSLVSTAEAASIRQALGNYIPLGSGPVMGDSYFVASASNLTATISPVVPEQPDGYPVVVSSAQVVATGSPVQLYVTNPNPISIGDIIQVDNAGIYSGVHTVSGKSTSPSFISYGSYTTTGTTTLTSASISLLASISGTTTAIATFETTYTINSTASMPYIFPGQQVSVTGFTEASPPLASGYNTQNAVVLNAYQTYVGTTQTMSFVTRFTSTSTTGGTVSIPSLGETTVATAAAYFDAGVSGLVSFKRV